MPVAGRAGLNRHWETEEWDVVRLGLGQGWSSMGVALEGNRPRRALQRWR
eukprot:gene719-43457_t